MGHRSLQVLKEGTVEKLDHKLSADHSLPRHVYYSSFRIWDQLKMLIQSKEYGPLLFNYHHERLRRINSELDEEEWYSDFYDKNCYRSKNAIDFLLLR